MTTSTSRTPSRTPSIIPSFILSGPIGDARVFTACRTLRWVLSKLRFTALTALLVATLAASGASAQTRAPAARTSKASVEYAPHAPSALLSLEVEVAGAAGEPAARHAVTDARLFVSKAGGDVTAALTAPDGEAAPAPPFPGGPPPSGALPIGSKALFNVRLFIVAGGRLYSAARGQCGSWESDVARCHQACEDGAFALRRNGAAPLELLVGAIPGGAAGPGPGLVLSECGLVEEDAEARLVPKGGASGGRGLAVAGFGPD